MKLHVNLPRFKRDFVVDPKVTEEDRRQQGDLRDSQVMRLSISNKHGSRSKSKL